MKGYTINIEKATKENENFRKVLYTAPNSQLVLMSLKPNEEIGKEIHELDQFIRIEEGKGRAVLNDAEYDIEDGSAIVIPAGVWHNIVNGSGGNMKLYTIYSPAEHKDGVVHITKEDAERDIEDHFDGKLTEEDEI
jgi:mannose-6-phosphate isomerase-like protein (cupin superfamily)